MTDNEIIKALECCSNETVISCNGCPLAEDTRHCTPIIAKNALDLINRQKEELDDLKRDTIPKLQEGLKRANKYGVEADKENEQLKAELERLNKLVIEKHKEINRLDEYIQYTKAEARKEFAERLKEYKIRPEFPWEDFYITESSIDELLEEMESRKGG